MMATLPIVQHQPLPLANLVGPLLVLHQNSSPILLSSKTIILIIAITNQKPHDIHCRIPRACGALHMFHVADQSHHAQYMF